MPCTPVQAFALPLLAMMARVSLSLMFCWLTRTQAARTCVVVKTASVPGGGSAKMSGRDRLGPYGVLVPRLNASAGAPWGGELRAQQRITAGEDEHRRPQLGELADEAAGLLAIEFIGMAVRLRLGPAVPAGEGAGPGDFPKDQKRTLIEAIVGHGRPGGPCGVDGGHDRHL